MSQLVFIFLIFSFTGWLIELVFRSLYERRLVNPGFHKGPWLPLYGLCGSAIYLVSGSIGSDSILIRIFIYYTLCTSFEFVAGIFLLRVFKRRYWDYSSNRLNFMGLVCPLYSAAWVLISLIVDAFIIPVIQPVTAAIPTSLLTKADVFLMAVFLIDFMVSSGIISNVGLRSLRDRFS